MTSISLLSLSLLFFLDKRDQDYIGASNVECMLLRYFLFYYLGVSVLKAIYGLASLHSDGLPIVIFRWADCAVHGTHELMRGVRRRAKCAQMLCMRFEPPRDS